MRSGFTIGDQHSSRPLRWGSLPHTPPSLLLIIIILQGRGVACSFAFSRLLQPSVRGVEDLGVLASCHRPLSSHPFSGFISFQDGDHPVRSFVGSSGGLDGVHRLEGGLLAGPCSSRLSQASTVRRF